MAAAPHTVSVLVVGADALTRAGVVAILAQDARIAVAGQVADPAGLAGAIEAHRPDVILWDLGWQPKAHYEALADAVDLSVPVVALLSDEAHASEVWTAGSRALLPRSVEAETLAAALHAAAQGLAVLHADMAAAVLALRPGATATLPEALTPREAQVLALMAQGLPNKGIADRLEVTEHTVKFHVNAILGKLGAQSRTEAVVQATRMGLVPL